ncbi:MAG TPA: HAD family hydrolase [Phycisphaerae bacterium]|nr:HAD family hydrolase [Phycisphaerae bacterium]HNU45783.1 HAD family hydrolase [Phycisphaerae bacterium]
MQDRPRGAIFDLDGTLCDTLADIAASVNFALAQAGRPPVTPEQVRLAVGGGITESLRQVSDPAVAPAERDRLVLALLAGFRGHYHAHCLDHTTLYSGLEPVLDELTRRGVPLAVLSNKPDEFTQSICAALLKRWRFIHIEGERADRPLKPDPARALVIAQMMKRPPHEVYFVGDSDTDIETGRRAGMIPVACTWGLREESVLRAAHPDHLVYTPGELLRLWQQGGT